MRSSLGPASVAVTVKHFPGAGPASEGQDAHFPWGKNQVYPGGNLDYHLLPWKAAIREGAAMIMPYYAVPKGLTGEEVGMAYSKEIIGGLLRGTLGYTGVVNSDTGITTGMPWGVETLSVKYPQGAEKMLISALLGRDVPSGRLPIDVHAIVVNVATASEIGHLLPHGHGIQERGRVFGRPRQVWRRKSDGPDRCYPCGGKGKGPRLREGGTKMEWEMVVAIAVATPIILLPVAFVWYLNLAGLYAAVTEARKARKGAKATA